MRVSKWGNSLAIRIPSSLVEALKLKEGDDISGRIRGDREFEIARDHTREDALRLIGSLRKPLPPGWKFSREDAVER